MGHVIPEFKRSLRIATGEPIHIAVVAVLIFLASALGFVLGLIPLVGPLVSGIFVTPVMLAGILGSADAARNGTSPLDGAKQAVSDAWKSLVGAFAILYAGWFVLGLVFAVIGVLAVFVLGLGGSAAGGAGAAEPMAPVVGALGILGVLLILLVVLAAFLVGMALQFVGPAAVLAGTGAVESLKTSYRLFRHNVLGVLGFTAIVAVVVGVAYAVPLVLFLLGNELANGTVALGLGGVGYVLTFAVVGGVTTVYQVTYFDAVADDDVLPADHDGGGAGTDPADEAAVGDGDAGYQSPTDDAGVDASAGDDDDGDDTVDFGFGDDSEDSR